MTYDFCIVKSTDKYYFIVFSARYICKLDLGFRLKNRNENFNNTI